MVRRAYAHRVTGRVRPEGLAAAVERSAAAGTPDRADDRADDRALRAQLLQLVQRFVPFDSYAFVLTDPVTTVGSSPLAEIPDLTTLPDLVRLKYLTPVNRWTGLPPSGCATLQQATGGRLDQSLVWREYLAGCGVVDVLSAVFTDRFGTWGFLDLWRRDDEFVRGRGGGPGPRPIRDHDSTAGGAGGRVPAAPRLPRSPPPTRRPRRAGPRRAGALPDAAGPCPDAADPGLVGRAPPTGLRSVSGAGQRPQRGGAAAGHRSRRRRPPRAGARPARCPAPG